jgi:hypothetical protein
MGKSIRLFSNLALDSYLRTICNLTPYPHLLEKERRLFINRRGADAPLRHPQKIEVKMNTTIAL